MPKLYICTVGASIGLKSDEMRNKLNPLLNSDWDADASDFNKDLGAYIAGIDFKNNVTERRKLSAELNSLDRAGVGKNDSIVLLASDTAGCRVCVEKLKSVLIDCYKLSEGNVKIARVEGLQTKNASDLRKRGLSNFVREALRYINGEDYSGYDVVLNATGGFKCVVPFLTILGMLYRKPSIYIFDRSNELLYFPPLPFTFDLELLTRMKDVLLFIEDNVAVSEGELAQKLSAYPEEDKALFATFVEKFDDPRRDDLVTLSPLVYSLVQIEREAEKIPVEIATSALKELKKIAGDAQKNLRNWISYAQSPLWRAGHNHGKYGEKSDLTVYKQSNTAERVIGYVENGVAKIVLTFDDHDEYERGYARNLTRANFADEEFVQWSPELLS